MTDQEKLRIRLCDLPKRDAGNSDGDLAKILSRLGGAEGSPCELNCDCVIGLVCRDRVCTADW